MKTSYETIGEGSKPPHTIITKVEFFKGSNYRPIDVVRRWAQENHEPLFYDDYSKPYLRMYGGIYRYSHWEIVDNGDDTETVVATLTREK